ncbi:hypothetical protein MG293_005053 [Ovis ammon polii]|uniref:Uncharacterized protein n=1 Tax=Ovis ammon polii TaxID=230172 RepID=A0AAD4UE55_OVIAM|nr:hypothetical protein MG293_005053 [Ovis ammon polii]
MKGEVGRGSSGRMLSVTLSSEDFILGAMGRPVWIGGRVTTSPEELERWEEPGEWPTEGPEQSNTTDGGAPPPQGSSSPPAGKLFASFWTTPSFSKAEAQKLTPVPQGQQPARAVFAKRFWNLWLVSDISVSSSSALDAVPVMCIIARPGSQTRQNRLPASDPSFDPHRGQDLEMLLPAMPLPPAPRMYTEGLGRGGL